MDDVFDIERYTRPPTVTVSSGLALACALLNAMPSGSKPPLRKAGLALRAETLALQSEWEESERRAKPGDPRPADRAIDNGWSALHDRLDSYASLPADRYPRAARAAELFEAIFPRGLTFLKLPYAEEYAESEQRLARITRDKLATDIDELAGREFLAEVRLSHEAYGHALGSEGSGANALASNLAEALRRVALAITDYAIQVAATVEHANEESRRQALGALRPIDEHRTTSNRVSVRPFASTGATATAAVPDVPA